jgi:hypothetical protein
MATPAVHQHFVNDAVNPNSRASSYDPLDNFLVWEQTCGEISSPAVPASDEMKFRSQQFLNANRKIRPILSKSYFS